MDPRASERATTACCLLSSTETDDGKGQGRGERDEQRHGPDDSSSQGGNANGEGTGTGFRPKDRRAGACRARYCRAQDLSGPDPTTLPASSTARRAQRIAEQTTDIPVPHDRSGRGGGGSLQGFSQGQGSTACSGAEFSDIPVPQSRGGG